MPTLDVTLAAPRHVASHISHRLASSCAQHAVHDLPPRGLSECVCVLQVHAPLVHPPFPFGTPFAFLRDTPQHNPTCFAGPPLSTRCVIPTVRMLYVFVLQHTHHTFPLLCPFAFLTHPLSHHIAVRRPLLARPHIYHSPCTAPTASPRGWPSSEREVLSLSLSLLEFSDCETTHAVHDETSDGPAKLTRESRAKIWVKMQVPAA